MKYSITHIFYRHSQKFFKYFKLLRDFSYLISEIDLQAKILKGICFHPPLVALVLIKLKCQPFALNGNFPEMRYSEVKSPELRLR